MEAAADVAHTAACMCTETKEVKEGHIRIVLAESMGNLGGGAVKDHARVKFIGLGRF